MGKPRYLIVSDDQALSDVRTLLSLTTDTLRAIAEAIKSRDGLRSDQPAFRRIADRAGIGNADALAAYYAIVNLSDQRRAYEIENEHMLADLALLCPDEMAALGDEGTRELLSLFIETEEDAVIGKADLLQSAVVPHYRNLKSVCEIRPVFNTDRTSVEGALLVALLALRLHDADHKNKTVVFQATRDELHSIRTALDEAESKFAALNEKFGQTVEIY